MKNYRAFNAIAIGSIIAFVALVWGIDSYLGRSEVQPVVQSSPLPAKPKLESEPAPQKTPPAQTPALDTLLKTMNPKAEQANSMDGEISDLLDLKFIETINVPNTTVAEAARPLISSSAMISASSTPTSSGSSSGSTPLSGTPSATISGSTTSSADSTSTSSGSSTSNNNNTTPTTGGGGGGGTGGIPNYLSNIFVTVLPSAQKLIQDDISAPGSQSAELFCAKNETEAFQVIVTNKSFSTLPDINFTVSDWVRPSGAGPKNPKITLFREHYVRIDKPSYGLTSKPGMYPDALVPFADPYTGELISTGIYRAAGASVAPQCNQGYWVDIRVDSDVKAGTYRCTLSATTSGRELASIPVTLQVWDFTLPKQRSFITWYYGFYDIHQYYGLPRSGGELYTTLMDRHRDLAYEHGVYPVPQFTSSGLSRDPDTGIVTFTPHFISQLQKFVDKYGIGVISIPPSFIFSDPGNWVLHSDARIRNTLASYNAFSAANPWAGQFVVYIDEPRFENRAASVRHVKNLIDTTPASRIKMLITGSKYAYDLQDYIDIWVCYGTSVVADGAKKGYTLKELMEDFLTNSNGSPNGKIAWTNTSNTYTDASLLAYRDYAWYGYIVGATGGFGWRLTKPSTDNVDAWVQSRTYINPGAPELIYNGHAMQIYPGTPARVGISGIGGPIASMRLKTWRKAVEDFEYFKMLEDYTNKATVDAIVSKVVKGYETYAAPSEYESARRTIAELILQYN